MDVGIVNDPHSLVLFILVCIHGSTSQAGRSSAGHGPTGRKSAISRFLIVARTIPPICVKSLNAGESHPLLSITDF